MEWEEIETELRELSGKLGIEIRNVCYEGEGGVYAVKGKKMLAVNERLAAPDRVAVIAKAIGALPEIDKVYVMPEIRKIIDRYRAET